jgi:hypothetical protein
MQHLQWSVKHNYVYSKSYKKAKKIDHLQASHKIIEKETIRYNESYVITVCVFETPLFFRFLQ